MQTKEERERRGVPLSVRIAKSTHDELNRLAREGDKSVTQTVERLLDRALRDEQRSADILEPALALKYGPRLAQILLAMAEVMNIVGGNASFAKSGKNITADNWCADPWAFDQAVQGVHLALDRARPEGKIVAPPPVADEERASKFWTMSPRYLVDHPTIETLRRAFAGEPAAAGDNPFLFLGFQQLAEELNGDDGRE